MDKIREDKKSAEKEKKAVKKDKPYEIPNEGSCSPEFPQGCIIQDNQ